MGARGHRSNLKRKRTSKEATASAPSSSESVDHADELTKRKNKTNQLLASMKPAAAAAEEAQPAVAGKKTKEKRKRVVRDRLSEKVIGIMIIDPWFVDEIPDEELAQRSDEFRDREYYAKSKARSEKWIADEQALIDQYLINGYAESVREVTDDEDDGDGDDTRRRW